MRTLLSFVTLLVFSGLAFLRGRREQVIVFNEDHLRRLLRGYVTYYNKERVHTRLRDAPVGRAVEARPSSSAKVVGLPRVGGLHHRYIWQEAA